jgi:hypothetical protein
MENNDKGPARPMVFFTNDLRVAIPDWLIRIEFTNFRLQVTDGVKKKEYAHLILLEARNP